MISRLGEGPISMSTDDVSICQPVLNHWRHSYARFMFRKAQPGSYPECAGNFSDQKILRAKCFLLPLSHAQRVKLLYGMRDRGNTSPHHSLPNIEGNGWSEKGLPIKCLVPPAPRAVVELVKCGCKGECKRNCYCANNGLACPHLCKCHAAGCSDHKDYHEDDQDEDTEEEEDFDL